MLSEIYFDPEITIFLETLSKKAYNREREYFKDQGIDVDDFIQEMWCELFEEKGLTNNRALCFRMIECNILDWVRNVKRRAGIASMLCLDEIGEL